VLLDTNALLLPFRSGVDLVGEVERLAGPAEIVVPRPVVAELDRLAARGVAHAAAARALADRFRPVASVGRGDAAVVAAADRFGATVVTADRALADRLGRAGRTVLVPRDRTRLHRIDPPAARDGRRAATVKKRPPLEAGR